jgi:hypothetical protein
MVATLIAVSSAFTKSVNLITELEISFLQSSYSNLLAVFLRMFMTLENQQ